MKKAYITLALLVISLLTSCAALMGVRQSDLDLWVDVPVLALDTHSLFLTVPMVKTITDSGIEIRNYVNKRGVASCGGTGRLSYSNFNTFQTCSTGLVGCDNIFYIRDGKVIEYKPVGHCYTDETVRPEKGWERFLKK